MTRGLKQSVVSEDQFEPLHDLVGSAFSFSTGFGAEDVSLQVVDGIAASILALEKLITVSL